MADSEHNVKININGNEASAVGALSRVKSALQGIQNVAADVTRALGWFHLAVNGVNMLVNAFKWLKDKVSETAREIAKLRFDFQLRTAANETARLVGFHEKLSKLMKDELDTLSKQRAVADIKAQGIKDYEDGKREADRARAIFEAKTPEEEQALRDKFADEDERLARSRSRDERETKIRILDSEETTYSARAAGLRRTNAEIDKQLDAERWNVRVARGNRKDDEEEREAEKAAKERVRALEAQKKANEETIAQWEKEAEFRRDQIAALENMKDYDGPTAGHWERKTEEKKRAEEAAREENERKAAQQEENKKDAEAFVRGYEEDQKRENEQKAASLESFAERAASFDGVSQNRLTAMGLGSGVSASGTVQSDVHKLVDLLRQNVEATKDIKISGASDATYTP